MPRGRHGLTLVALALVTLLAGGRVWAQRAIDVETFRPALDNFGIITVERAQTARQFDFGFKLYLDYAHEPLRLAMKGSPTDTNPALAPMMEFQVGMHVGLFVGLTDWMELALDVPASAQRYAAAYGSPLQDPANPGMGNAVPTGFYAAEPRSNVGPPDASPLDPRIALKLRTRRFGPLGLGLVAAATVPFGNDYAFLGEAGFTFRPTAIVDLSVGRFALALNGGAIIRKQSTVLDPMDVAGGAAQPAHLISVGSEVTVGLGASLRAAWWLGFAVEGYALVPVTSESGPGVIASKDHVLDVLGAIQIFPGSGINLSLGAGGGLLDSRRHDGVRAFFGIGWSPTGAKARATGNSGDRDGDGISDRMDPCPDEPEDKDGFEDEDGCPDPDNDGDGVPDAQDKCPLEMEDADGVQDADGCPEPDNDEDGVRDLVDQCPDDPEDKDGFDDDDGCPEPDNDADGIPDATDRCPNEPETLNGIDDGDGCPDSGAVPATTKRSAPAAAPSTVLSVSFGRSSTKLSASSMATLGKAVARLKEALGTRRLRVSGHADGGEPRAADLARARAERVRAELVHQGLDGARVEAVGEKPEVGNKHHAARVRARRVDLVVVE